MAHCPGVLLPVVARFGVHQHVVDPASRLGGAQQVVSVKMSCGVNTKARVPASKHRVVVRLRYGIAVFVDDEDVPLAVNALPGVVVGHRILAADGVIKVDSRDTTALV